MRPVTFRIDDGEDGTTLRVRGARAEDSFPIHVDYDGTLRLSLAAEDVEEDRQYLFRLAAARVFAEMNGFRFRD